MVTAQPALLVGDAQFSNRSRAVIADVASLGHDNHRTMLTVRDRA